MSSPLVFHHPILRSAANALYASNTATSAIHPESSSSSSPLGSSLHDRHLSSSSSSSPMSQVLPSSSSSSSLSLSVTAPAAASPRLCTQSNHLSSTQSSSLSLSNSSSPVRTTVCCEIDELLESGLSLEKAMIAGAVAGVTEHVSMFPLDTIKTRMQVLLPKGSKYSSISQTIGRIYHEEGFFRLYRGVTAVVAAAIPSHAVHYASYEFAKAQLGANQAGHRPLETAVAGSIATMAHDAVVTPLDVIKQRMQMFNSQYISVKAAASRILREEGIRGFYASYPTTVAMNIPFVSVYFTAYESMKLVLTHQRQHHTETEGVREHLIAGGISGASAGFISTPFDVVKTRLQTQHAVIANGIQREIHVGALGMFRRIWTAEGFRGFFKGASARMLYNTPSAAICWTTYETLKNALRDAW